MRMALRTRSARTVAAVLVAAPLSLAPFAIAAPAAALPRQAAPDTVEALVESKFSPDTLTVPAGTTVTWVNTGGSHTVTGGAGTIDPASPIGDNPLSNLGDTVKKTFDQPGTYPYFCQPHASLGMKGVIIVTAAAAGGSSRAGSSSAGSSSAGASGGSASGSASAAPGSLPGSAAPSGSNAASASAGAVAGASGSGSAAAGSGAVTPSAGSPDPSLGAKAIEDLDLKLQKEQKPLTSFRLALWGLVLGIFVVGAGIYFMTKPRRDEE
jgi:plastocyanin